MTQPTSTQTVPFVKMHGCGNDFIYIDNRVVQVPVAAMADWAKLLCPRATAIGADGLVFLEPAPGNPAPVSPAPDRTGVDYIWHFYNADGSRAEMCGNASRCAARLAVEWGLAGENHVLGTDAGPIRAEVLAGGKQAKVQLTPPKDLKLSSTLELPDGPREVHFVNTGVPHAVLIVESARAEDISVYGPALRYHEAYKPAGTNANIVSVVSPEKIVLRTYERGVEDETLACGTGAAAGALITYSLGLTGPEVAVESSGGEILRISIAELDGERAVFLQGSAVKVFQGQLLPEAVGL